MRHSANLDILRSFAILMVLLDHLLLTLAGLTGFQNPAVVTFASAVGHVGVLAFFVHTSLVLMYSLERMTHSAHKVTLRFYLRRFFRIYPLAIFCITLALVFNLPNVTWDVPDVITPRIAFFNYLLMQNLVGKVSVLTPLWSLPYEVQMYLVLPALYFLTLRKRASLILAGLYLFFCAAGVAVYHQTGGHLNMAAYIPCFLCGVFCYSLRDRIRATVPAFLWPVFLLLLIAGYCLVGVLMTANDSGLGESTDKGSYWLGWIFCLLLGLAINAFHDSSAKYLNLVAEKIALYSYGAYLIHIPILYLVFQVMEVENQFLGILLFAVLTIFSSVITYHFIESPCMELGRRLSSRPEKSTVTRELIQPTTHKG